MARYHGRKAKVLMSTTGSGTAEEVVSISSWSLDRSTDTVEVTSFGDLNKTYVQGLPDVSGEFSGYWDDTEGKIWSGADSGDGVKLYMYPDFTNAPTKYVYGTAWLSASIETGVGDAVTIDASFVARGSWGTML